MIYECILCGKVVDTGKIIAPAGWQMYYSVWLCEECSPKLGEKLDLIEFLRELKTAESTLKFAQEYNVPYFIKDRIKSLISEIQQIIEYCRQEQDIIDAESFSVTVFS